MMASTGDLSIISAEAITIAAKPLPQIARQLQRTLASLRVELEQLTAGLVVELRAQGAHHARSPVGGGAAPHPEDDVAGPGVEGVGEEPGLKSVARTTARPASIIARASG